MNQMIGQKAPDFKVMGVSESGDIQSYALEDFAKQFVVLFFYPLDFTFVCPLELIEMSKMISSFKESNAVVLGVSVDSEHTHAAWRNTAIEKGGIGPIQYPLLADVNRSLIQSYGVANADPQIALRATVIIDPQGIVRVQHVNDLPLGRNPGEILRLVKAIAFHDEYGNVCPPNWEPGQKSLAPTREGLEEYHA